MNPLLSATLPLAVGPLLGRFLGAAPAWMAFVDGFVLAAILGLVPMHLMPEAVAAIGGAAFLLAAGGLALPTFAERFLHSSHRDVHRWVAVAAVVGLGIHAGLEGAALAHAAEGHAHAHAHVHAHGEAAGGQALLWGVLLHRIPLSLTIWWTMAPLFGAAGAIGVLGGIAGLTAAGFYGAEVIEALLGGPFQGAATALVAGGLVHIAWHQPQACQSGRHPRASGFGALLGLGLLALCPDQLAGGMAAAATAFKHLVLESAPALALGFTTAGLVGVMLPQAGVAWLRAGGRGGQALKGLVFGLPLPVCSCGVVPLYRSLRDRGAPVVACLAFLVATPEIGLDAVLISLPLLGPRMTAARVGAAFVLAFVVAIAVGSLAERDDAPAAEAPARDPGSPGGFAAAMRYGWAEIVDHTGPWILVGFLAAAALEPFDLVSHIAGLAPWQQTLALIVVGLPVYLCASAATPLGAVLLQQGVAPGAVVAFLLAGPASNWTTFGVLRQLHGPRVAVLFVLAMVFGCFGVSAIVEALPVAAGGHGAAPEPGHGSEPGPLAWAATALLALAFFRSVMARGPRAWISEVIGESHGHDHDHHGHGHGDHHHGHGHHHAHGDHHHGHGHDHGDQHSGCGHACS